MPPARSHVGWQHLGAVRLQRLQKQPVPTGPAGFFSLANSSLTRTGKVAQGGICRSCTAEDSACVTSSHQTSREVMLQVQKDSSSIIIIIIFPTYVSIHLVQAKRAMPWHHPSSPGLLFLPIPPAGGMRLGLCSSAAPPHFASVYQLRTPLRALGDT